MLTLLTGTQTVWPALAKALSRTQRDARNAFVAISYIGSRADNWLCLRRGDVLICDASDEAVRLGLTSVEQLRRWFDADVEVYSRPGLHAKTGVAAGVTFIGSANASESSAVRRNEAVLWSDDVTLRASVRAYVQDLRDSPSRVVDAAELDRLDGLPVRRLAWPTSPPAWRPAVPGGGRLFLWDWEYDVDTSQEAKVAAKATGENKALRQGSDHAEVTWLEDTADRRFRTGDIFLWCSTGRPWTSPPAVIEGKIPPASKQRPGLIYVVRGDLRSLRTRDVEAAIRSAQPTWRRRKAVTQLQGDAREAVADLVWHKKRYRDRTRP